MSTLPEIASVHEDTVQAVARGEVEPPPRRRRRSTRPVPVAGKWGIRVHPQVWAQVRGVPMNRVQVVSEYEVIIWNHPAPWPGVE